MSHSTSVELLGNVYRIRTDLTEDKLAELARMIEQRGEVLLSRNPKPAPANILAVVALSLAEELERVRLERAQLRQETIQVLSGLLQELDHQIDESTKGE